MQTYAAGRRTYPRRLSLLVLAFVLALAIARWQPVADWWKLHQYHPSATIVSLADQTTMTDAARRYFYLNNPQIEGKTLFATHCPQAAERTIVLGCYQAGERGIHVLQVSDARLQGVEQVTAAHETLHAAYERLSPRDKQYINGLLQDYAEHGLQDQRIKDTLKSYESSEPGQQLNEMHSIFGTEIANLPPSLEQYYRRYFTKRSQIVAYTASYQAAFTSRRQAVEQADVQLKAWKVRIDQNTSTIEHLNSELKTLDAQLEGLKRTGQYDAYNTGVAAYNAKVDTYNADIAATKNLITQYNQLVEHRNAIALEESQLIRAIDASKLSPIDQ